MDKVQALGVLLGIQRHDKQPTPPQWRRMIRAFETLGLTPAEMRDAAGHWDITRSDGNPFNLDIPADAVPWPTGPRKESK